MFFDLQWYHKIWFSKVSHGDIPQIQISSQHSQGIKPASGHFGHACPEPLWCWCKWTTASAGALAIWWDFRWPIFRFEYLRGRFWDSWIQEVGLCRIHIKWGKKVNQNQPSYPRLRTEDDESGPPTVHRSTVDLRVGAIDALHSLTEASDQSVFAVHALDPARITALLKTPPCDCGCRLPADILKKTCRSFWSLPKQSQDALLWNLQVGSGSSKRKWMIEGPIVKQGFCVRLTCLIIYKRYIYIYIYINNIYIYYKKN